MLSMEYNTEMVLVAIFVVSMLGSIERSDINSTYSLFSYMFLASYRYKTSLDQILNILLIVTLFVLLSDIWAFYIMTLEPISVVGHLFAYGIIIAEFGLKLFLLIMISCWRFSKTKTESDLHKD
jgi:hypothetical protein